MKEHLSRRPVYVIAGVFAGIFLVAGGVLLIAKTNPEARQALLADPLVQHFKHTYNSVKKLSDLLFTPYLLASSSLPTYYISIPLDNIVRMNAALPTDPFEGKLSEENKQFVKAEFKDLVGNYSARVDIKYRGVSANHWNALQKSYRVQFPTGNYFKGQRLINFVTPYDRKYYIEPLNAYRAKKLGLITLDMQFVRLNINGEDTGVYLMFEHWSPEFLAKKGLPESKMFGNADGIANSAGTLADYVNMFDKEGDTKKEEIATLLAIRDAADDATFRKLIPQILDMEKFYNWSVLTVLSGSTHQSEATNPVLYFNIATGKFELVPWDTEVADVEHYPYDDTTSVLLNRIMRVSEFRVERDKRLAAYINDPANLADDLAFYDRLVAATKTDFYKDAHKFDTTFTYLSYVARYRQWVIDAFNEANKVIASTYAYPRSILTRTPVFSGSFKQFADLAFSIDQFLTRHPQFYKIDATTVGLSGTHVFTSDVTVPPGIGLTIVQGSTLFLDAGVSLFVHGPVLGEGTALSPISIARLNPNKAWGTFAVINAGTPSTLRQVHADGGSGAIENGIVITGMIAFHGSDVTIISSSFSNSGDDDLVNSKFARIEIERTVFSKSLSDALDIDYPKEGSYVRDTTFTVVGSDGNGDAIDLSWANIEVQGNTVNDCNDKGVSVGEHSKPIIENNTFIGCSIGIAVKDLSDAAIFSNTFTDNETAISLYRKKDEFGGGHAVIGQNIFTDSETKVKMDMFSTVEYTYD